MKIVKVVWTTPIWFDEQKYGWGAVIKGVSDAQAADLERKHMVVILGDDDEGEAAPAPRKDVEVSKPARLEKPAKPAKGPAPSIDDLLKE